MAPVFGYPPEVETNLTGRYGALTIL